MNIEKTLEEIRSRYRKDAGEEGETNGTGGRGRSRARSGGHGNVRLPYGLAKAEGIDTVGLTPKEVWKALAGEGYSPAVAYQRLKEGKHGKDLKGTKPTKQREGKKSFFDIKPAVSKIDTTVMPASFSAAKMKTTVKSYVDTINSTCKDEDAMRFMRIGNKGKTTKGGVSIVKKKSDMACLVTYMNPVTGQPTEMKLEIPEISKNDSPEIVNVKVRTFVHEYTHYIDSISRGETGIHFTETFKALTDAIEEEQHKPIGAKASLLFKEYNARYDAVKEKQKGECAVIYRSCVASEFGEVPAWMKEDGTLDYNKTPSPWTKDWDRMDKCLKNAKKEIKKIATRHSLEKRAIGNGNIVLQGLYDSISHGKARANGDVKYGHSLQYFSKGHKNAASELLADFVSASIMNPDLVEIFAEDYPKTAKALRSAMITITKNLEDK